MTRILVTNLLSDPNVNVGGYMTIERADGRNVWRQRMKLIRKTPYGYMFEAVAETHGYTIPITDHSVPDSGPGT